MKLPFELKERKVLVKRDSESSSEYGIRPFERGIPELLDFGIVNIDKPAGPSSHQVSAYVRQVLGLKKSGHSGTLDPMVTGVLPVALGRGTRIAAALLPAGKEYVCVMHLHQDVERERVERVLAGYVGSLKQLPPVRSAVKRQWRMRQIYYVKVLDMQERDVLFRVGCQGGTYIRKLVHQAGEDLGVGAHMIELRRTKAGPFDESSLASLYDLEDALFVFEKEGKEDALRRIVQPVEVAVGHLGKVWVLDSGVDSVCHGASLKVPGIAKVESGIAKDDLVALLTLKGELIALGSSRMSSEEMVGEEKGVAVSLNQVLMKRGTYPKVGK